MTTAPTSSPRDPAPRTRTAGDVVEVAPRTAAIAGGIVVAALVLTFWDFFRKQFLFAVTQPQDWAHTLLVPVISGYFVWLSREKLLAQPFRPSWWGLPILLVGIGIYMASAFGPATLQHHNVLGLGVGVSVLGILLALFGTHAMRWLWFPWAYWVCFGQTISERALSRVTEKLQDLSAVGAHIMLNTFGIDTERAGNVLTVHMSDGRTAPLNVAEACSGMRTLVAFMAIGVALAALGLPRWWQRVLLVAVGVPISLFVNILRVGSLGVLTMFDANLAAGEFHSMVGLLWLVPAFLLFLGAMWVIRNLVVDEPAAGAKGGAGHAV